MTISVDAFKPPYTPAVKFGVIAICAAFVLAWVDIRLAVAPLALFLSVCAVAPFFPGFGFYLPVVSRGHSAQNAVALTFDDGPDPATTLELLDLLAEYETTAMFFVTGKRARRYPELIRSILANGHSIGNHSFHHTHLALFKGSHTLDVEIDSTQSELSRFGVQPLAFRPPAGITNPRFAAALDRCGLYVVNFSCRALDGGNRWIDRISKRILSRVRSGDIVLLHDSRPKNNRAVSEWLEQVEQILVGLDRGGFKVLPLADLIGRPVMLTRTFKKNDPPSGKMS